MRHRAALLRAVLPGLSRQSVKRTLLPRLKRWFPERTWYREGLLRALLKWPELEAWGYLRLALINDDHTINQVVAAGIIGTRWAGDASKRTELLELAHRPYAPEVRAVILRALLVGWPGDAETQSILNADGSPLSPELTLLQVLAGIEVGEKSAANRDTLMSLLCSDGVHYAWRSTVTEALLSTWPGDLSVRDACLNVVRERALRRDRDLTPDVAWGILLEGYPMDDEVASALITELDKEHPLFASVDWSILGRKFRDHAALGARLESWIEKARHIANRRSRVRRS